MKISWKTALILDIKKVFGPYRREDNRARVIVQKIDGVKKSMLLSRLLMCIKENRWLKHTEHVDHEDENPTNDNIANLQILSPIENILKYHKLRKPHIPKPIKSICTVCKQPFESKYPNKKICSPLCKETLSELKHLTR